MSELAVLEPIDAHTHIAASGLAFLGMLERAHMHVLDILYVDDTTPYRSSLERQRQDAIDFIAASKGRAALCTTFDPFRFDRPDFAQGAIEQLNHDFDNGAVAAKLWKNLGMEIKTSAGLYIMPDDPKLEPIYQDISNHNKTLIIHAAEPDAAWNRQYANPMTERYYTSHPEWDMSKKPDAPSKQSILESRNRMLRANRNLRVIGAHLGSMETDLVALGALLDQNPNFAVDTAARMVNLTIQPSESVRSFILKYQDRILYGTDLSFVDARDDQDAAETWEHQYARDWRYLSTRDHFSYWGRKVEGLGLPDSVLRKLYHDNAIRWISGIWQQPH